MNSEILTQMVTTAEPGSEYCTLEELATQFVDEYRRWLNPSIEDYATAYPEYASEIRESFPVLIAMEEWKGNQEITCLKQQAADCLNLRQLGNCHLTREMSRSRTAIIFEAVQGAQRRPVAVKLMPWKSELTPRWRDRFEREARLTFRLKHQNIISIYSTGEDQGYSFAVMQQVRGVGLNQVIACLSGAIHTEIANCDQSHPGVQQAQSVADSLQQDPWRGYASLALQMANALRYAHSRGTLHNDFRPENILVNSDLDCWLTGFALPQFAEGALKQQQTLTLRNQSPERFCGEVSEQSDLYSVGMTLYELATGVPAFAARNSQQLLELITHSEPQRPGDLATDMPTSFEAIILNCISRSPGERYQTADELSIDLVRFLNGKSVRRRVSRQSAFRDKWSWFWRKTKCPLG
ncbi:Serine/threonine-protein kinase PknH [Gimesia panareensis]|uniref:Serine/threonine-protein kinase PknH n=1 Tax=Gimesia panareensis TaxID=2527978 RepID=A0A517Q3V0_9PLAN|nr:serine/threonine-protein kinase [Gimesia panareensis]QDT26305.1 Serine/threonine-protein kinase PknH [Gimesia panareensis]